ncbi:MAG: hypothetical protein HFG05_05080 [Oscillibacter sp.]|nr:hypothetical protein [Oscillibacter sp.]
MKRRKSLWKSTEGYAVVEATILFPFILMAFAGLVLLSMYLPTRAVLQRETQYAATALATIQSDTWLDFDKDQLKFYWRDANHPPSNVYAALFAAFFKGDGDAETVVGKLEEHNIVSRAGELTVSCEIHNFVVYKEIAVTATRTIPVPVNLSFVNFPEEIPITVSSTAVVQNGDEFVRNIDIAKDFVKYLDEEYDLKIKELANWVNKAWKFLGV